MELSAVQNRTLAGLIDAGDGVPVPVGVEGRLRDRIEGGIRDHLPGRPLRLWKERLNDLSRCEGLFWATLTEERPPFRHTPPSAAGTLMHKAVEMDVWTGGDLDPAALAERAAGSLEHDRQFGPYWHGLDAVGRGEVLMRAVQDIELFRASFPPLRPFRRLLAPVCEQWLEASFGGGMVVVVGKVDLMLNVARPDRATRVLIDLKGGQGWGDHPEDMRLYALLYTLRYGVPPARVATFFPRSGGWQPEEVGEQLLEHAADRAIAAVRAGRRLHGGSDPRLSAGPWCPRCVRRPSCPAAAAGMDAGREGFD